MSNSKSRQASRRAGGYKVYQLGGVGSDDTSKDDEVLEGRIPPHLIRIIFRGVVGSAANIGRNLTCEQQVSNFLNRVRGNPSAAAPYGTKHEIAELTIWVMANASQISGDLFPSPLLSTSQSKDLSYRIFERERDHDGMPRKDFFPYYGCGGPINAVSRPGRQSAALKKIQQELAKEREVAAIQQNRKE